MLLQACLNGARRPAEHPALPTTPVKLARDVAAVVAAGAQSVHLHVKDSDGNDTMRATELAEVLAAVQATAGRVPVGITTGAWAEPDPAARVAAVESWTALPDFASVDWHEDGADQVAAALLAREVGVEAGLWHADGAAAWLASPHRDRCLRVLIELPDGLDDDGTVAAADELLAVVSPVSDERPGSGVPVLLHGEGSSTWPALRHAGRLELATRIGLEDVLELPDGSPASGNAALVSAARRLLTERQASGSPSP